MMSWMALGGRGGVAAGMALKLAKKDDLNPLRWQPNPPVANELTCGITRSRTVRIAETESSPSYESADALSAGTWPKTGQNRALAARARAKAGLIKKSSVPVNVRTVEIQSTTCQLPSRPGTVREKRLRAGSAARGRGVPSLPR